MNNIVEVESLTKTFPPAARVVDGISFSVAERTVFSLLGPNGAGKTTTIRMLTTLTSITEGKALVGGHDVGKDPAVVRSLIGVVPQEVTLDNELKGIENLLLAARLHHVPKVVARKRAKELLRLVDLEDSENNRVSTYSGGMKRRLQLVTALVHEPRILFFDEPTVGLDIQTRTRIWDDIRGLNREHGLKFGGSVGKGLRNTRDEMNELLDALAAGIFRGEGTTVGTVIGWRRKTPTPPLMSSVRMCDRNSVEFVAKSPGWNSKVRLETRKRGHCSTEGFEWETSVSAVYGVRNAILPWIVKGYLRGESRPVF